MLPELVEAGLHSFMYAFVNSIFQTLAVLGMVTRIII